MAQSGLPIDSNTLTLQHLGAGRKLTTNSTQIATPLFAGLFEEGTVGYALWVTTSWQNFSDQWSVYSGQGLRLCSFATDEEIEGDTTYLGAYIRLSGGYGLLRTPDWASFMQAFNNNALNMQLLDFDIHPSSSMRYYTGVWGGTPVHQTIVADLDSNSFTAKWHELSAGGMRLVKAQAFPSVDTFHLTGVFESGSDGYAFLMTTDWNHFIQTYNNNLATMQLVDYQVFDQPPCRYYLGVWRQTTKKHRFIYDLDWGSFTNQWHQLSAEGLRLKKVIQYPNHIELPEPKWQQFYQANLAGAAGYAFVAAHNGQFIAEGAVGDARTAADQPVTNWTIDTRIHLASVSKPITAVALLKLLSDRGLSFTDPFYPLVESKCPTAGTGVNTVTIADLLSMKSGMVVDGTLSTPDIWTFLAQYLQQSVIGTPGVTYAYSNTNFTILQAIIALLSDPANQGGDGVDPYVNYVNANVFTPMGIDTNIFSWISDPQNTSALTYGISDDRQGQYWEISTASDRAVGSRQRAS